MCSMDKNLIIKKYLPTLWNFIRNRQSFYHKDSLFIFITSVGHVLICRERQLH